jgi:hypothetical protein
MSSVNMPCVTCLKQTPGWQSFETAPRTEKSQQAVRMRASSTRMPQVYAGVKNLGPTLDMI